MSASSPTARSVGMALGSALAVAAILFAAFTALSGSHGTTDSKPPRPHGAPTASGTAPAPPAASSGESASSDEPTCNLFDTECQEEHPDSPVSQSEDGTGGSRAGASPRFPDPPQGTAATGGGGVTGGTE